jgi:microcompartment protein CcmL/EutN
MVAIGLAETKGLIALVAATDALTETKETVP